MLGGIRTEITRIDNPRQIHVPKEQMGFMIIVPDA